MHLFKVGGNLSRTNSRRSMDSSRTERSYKYSRAEGIQLSYFYIYLYASRCKVNSFTNGQYCESLVYNQDVGNSQQDFIRHMRRDLGPLAIKRDLTMTVDYLTEILNQEVGFQS